MKRLKQTVIWVLATLVVSASIGVWSAAASEPARARIEHFDGQLVATMKQASELGFEGRYRKLAAIIDETFDLQRIARLALGGEWTTLDAGQQKAYLDKFRKDTIATYAQRFDGYDGQRFEITGTHNVAGARRQVDTVIIDASGKRTPISYVLDNEGGEWRVINVVARGVSDLALKRGQYTGVIRDQGPEAFLDHFDRQLAKYPALPPS